MNSCHNSSVSGAPLSASPRFAYIAQLDTNGVVVCTLDSVGAYSDCAVADVEAGTKPQNVQGIVLNQAGTRAFMTLNSTDNVMQCDVNDTIGAFSNCTTTAVTSPTGFDAHYGMLTLNPNESLAYLVDEHSGAARVVACAISSGVIQDTCTDVGMPSGSSEAPAGITLNAAGTKAFVHNDTSSNTLFVCAVAGTTFSACNAVSGGGAVSFMAPTASVLSHDESRIYITDSSANKIYICDSSTVGNRFTNCADTGAPANGYWGITLNSNNSVAYATDFISRIFSCSLNSNGTFNTCSNLILTGEPTAITLKY